MKKRFSATAFILDTLIHFLGTWLLWMQSERAYAEWKQTGVEVIPVWSTLCMWILQPIAMFLSYYTRHHPPAVKTDVFERGLIPTDFILPWTLFVGICFGFLIPLLSRWRHQPSNRAMQRSVPRSDA